MVKLYYVGSANLPTPCSSVRYPELCVIIIVNQALWLRDRRHHALLILQCLGHMHVMRLNVVVT